MNQVNETLDRVYEAALLPEFWPTALASVHRFAGLDGGALFVTANNDTKWIATPPFSETVAEFVNGGLFPGNARNSRALALKHAGFITDQQILTPEELDREPMFTEFLRPRGWGWASGTIILMPTEEVLTFHFENHYHRGPVSQQSVEMLDALRPHLARAALMSCRLHLEKLQASLAGIEALGHPAAVVGHRARVLAANAGFEKLGSAFIATAHGGVALRNGKANELLKKSLEQVARGHGTHRSIAVPGNEEQPPIVIHVVPIRRNANDLFFGAEAFLVVTLVKRPKAPPFEILNALFDLTPGEARVTRLLTSGQSAAEIARTCGVSVETVRSQIRSVLQKSGMHRQAELVGFLAGIGTFEC